MQIYQISRELCFAMQIYKTSRKLYLGAYSKPRVEYGQLMATLQADPLTSMGIGRVLKTLGSRDPRSRGRFQKVRKVQLPIYAFCLYFDTKPHLATRLTPPSS